MEHFWEGVGRLLAGRHPGERFSVVLPLFPFLSFLGLLIEQSRNFVLLFTYFNFLVLYD